jgi:transcriptional regulator with PAS, ATPase and Fis domain
MTSQVSRPTYGLIGESAAMKALNRQIRTAAQCDLTVLISGESGTGKELVARAIHLQSSRANKPFVSLNCGTLTETLLESELFGYERGAFTGAVQKKKGLFEAAHTGTIFLDEIGELSTSSQVKLLRVLQESAFRPVGGHAEISFDARVIAATNRDLAKEMASGRFREDLYYRIAVLMINAPPLRQRPSDIPILIEHFLEQVQETLTRSSNNKIDAKAVAALSGYPWPGNVRQLRHIVERLIATAAEGATITESDIYKALPLATVTGAASKVPVTYQENDSLDDFLDRIMLGLYDQLLAKTGSHTQTARLLRTDRVSLYQRIERARRRLQVVQSC